jgi:tetratricopeptide (TPR) repeat protein
MNIQEQLDVADGYISSGDYSSAIKSYNEIIALAPENDEAWLMLGSLYGESGNTDKAIEHIEKALTINPDNGNAHLVLGQIKNALGDNVAAAKAFDRALQCNSDDVNTLCTRASLHQSQGELVEAIALFEKAVALDDTISDAWKVLGPMHFQNNNLVESEKCFKKALTFRSADPVTFIGYCNLLTSLGRTDESLQLLGQIPEEIRNTPQVLSLYSSAYSGEGKNAEALKYIDKAISQDSQDGFILSKADLLQTMSEYEQAFDLLKPYLQSEPPNASAAIILSKFAKFVDLEDECIQLLNKVSEGQQLSPYSQQIVLESLNFLNS